MGMEQAILEHASALKELAAAIRSIGVPGALAALAAASPGEIIAAVDGKSDTPLQDKAAELADAGELQVAAARQAEQKDAAENKRAADTANADKTVDVVAAVSAEIEAKGTVAPDQGDVTVVLDYAKDVRPMLLAAIKKGKRAEIEAHLAGAGVAKADQLKAEQLPAVLALATKLAA